MWILSEEDERLLRTKAHAVCALNDGGQCFSMASDQSTPPQSWALQRGAAAFQGSGIDALSLRMGGENRFDLWRKVLRWDGRPLSWLSAELWKGGAAAAEGRLAKVTVDAAAALALHALSCPLVRRLSSARGITLLFAFEERCTAFLLYQERVYGIFEHRGDIPLPMMEEDLAAFRLGWLPDEVVRGQGGFVSAFPGDLPQEAEGFVPTVLFGQAGGRFHGFGRFSGDDSVSVLAECRGLLYGLSMHTEQAQEFLTFSD